MKTPDELAKEGYELKAYSSNGCAHVTSFIAILKKEKRKVYGYWDYQKCYYHVEFI